jgi:hypothetical protein
MTTSFAASNAGLHMPSVFRGAHPKFVECPLVPRPKPFDDLAERIVVPIGLTGTAFKRGHWVLGGSYYIRLRTAGDITKSCRRSGPRHYFCCVACCHGNGL